MTQLEDFDPIKISPSFWSLFGTSKDLESYSLGILDYITKNFL